jgi:hypothetical protein
VGKRNLIFQCFLYRILCNNNGLKKGSREGNCTQSSRSCVPLWHFEKLQRSITRYAHSFGAEFFNCRPTRHNWYWPTDVTTKSQTDSSLPTFRMPPALHRSRDSSVDIVNWLWTGRPRGRSSSPCRIKNFLFFTTSKPALGSTQVLSNGYRGLFPQG